MSKPDTKAIRARSEIRAASLQAGQSITGGATALETIELLDRVEQLEAALRSNAQRFHLSAHSFKTNFTECREETCAAAVAALEGK